jgi:hypothetical protein
MADYLNPEDMAAQSAIARQQKLAEMLFAQGAQQPQGQMISGQYVKSSPLQFMANLANQYAGMKTGEAAEKSQLDLAQKLRGQQEQDIAKFGELLKTDPNAAYQFASKSYVPQLREAGLKKMMPQEFDLAEGAKRWMTMPDGTVRLVASGGEKLHSVKGNLVTSSGKVIYSAPLTGEEKVNPAESQLRSSFLNQATPHIQISQAYRKIETAPDTAAGDMSKIFGFMKILDPSSTVREGEYASAENARGVPDTVRAQYNKVMSGQRLSPTQRTQFNQAAGDLVKSQKEQFEGQKKYYEDISKNYRIDPANIIYDPYAGLNLQTTPPKLPKQPVNVGQQLGVPQAGNGWNILSVTPTK